MRLSILFCICAAGGISCSPLVLEGSPDDGSSPGAVGRRTLFDISEQGSALSTPNENSRYGRRNLLAFGRGLNSRNAQQSSATCQASDGGSAYSSSDGHTCQQGNGASQVSGAGSMPMQSSPILADQATVGGSLPSGSPSLTGAGLCSNSGSTNGTMGPMGPGNPTWNNGWGTAPAAGQTDNIGSNICGGTGCQCQAQFCQAIAQNGQSDQTCSSMQGTGGQSSLGTGTSPTMAANQNLAATANMGANTAALGANTAGLAATGGAGPVQTGSSTSGSPTCDNPIDSNIGSDPIGSDICGNGGCQSLADYCAAVARDGKCDPKCGTGSGAPSSGASVPQGSAVSSPQASQGTTGSNSGQGCVHETGPGGQQPTCSNSQRSRLMARRPQQAAPSSSASGGGGSGGSVYMASINAARDKFCWPHYTWSSSLESNAQATADQTSGSPTMQGVTEQPCMNSAQVTGAGTGPDSIDVTVDLWICEVPTTNVDGCTCAQVWKEYGFHWTERGHYDFLVGKNALDYSYIGCAYKAGPGGDGSLGGLWLCSLGKSESSCGGG